MNSDWTKILVCFRKEAACELRSKHGVLTSGLFGLMAVVAVSLASNTQKLSPNVASGILCVILLFSAVIAVPRIFLSEDDQGTLELFRLWASPGHIILGKVLLAGALQVVNACFLTILFLVLSDVSVTYPWIAVLTIPLLGVAISNCLSLGSMLVVGAANRWILAAVVSMPLLLPLIFLAVGALRVAFGVGSVNGAYANLLALLAYALLPVAYSATIAESLWGQKQDPESAGDHDHNERQG